MPFSYYSLEFPPEFVLVIGATRDVRYRTFSSLAVWQLLIPTFHRQFPCFLSNVLFPDILLSEVASSPARPICNQMLATHSLLLPINILLILSGTDTFAQLSTAMEANTVISSAIIHHKFSSSTWLRDSRSQSMLFTTHKHPNTSPVLFFWKLNFLVEVLVYVCSYKATSLLLAFPRMSSNQDWRSWWFTNAKRAGVSPSQMMAIRRKWAKWPQTIFSILLGTASVISRCWSWTSRLAWRVLRPSCHWRILQEKTLTALENDLQLLWRIYKIPH